MAHRRVTLRSGDHVGNWPGSALTSSISELYSEIFHQEGPEISFEFDVLAHRCARTMSGACFHTDHSLDLPVLMDTSSFREGGSEMGQTRPPYTPEFRLQIVELHRLGRTVRGAVTGVRAGGRP